MKITLSHYAILLVLILPCLLYGAKEDEPIKIGNFLLPASQQTTPLFGFGQNIMDKSNILFFLPLVQVGGKQSNLTAIYPAIFYGLRNDTVISVELPFTLTSKEGCERSGGANDMTIQVEKVIFTKNFINPPQSLEAALQSTLVLNMTIPTGSIQKSPTTGFGSPSFFVGLTLSYTAKFWEAWIQGGGIFPTKYHKVKAGNIFFYQAGFERCFSAKEGWLIAGIFEFLGNYVQKDQLCGIKDANSGQHSIYLAPSLWASSEKLRFQIGVAIPAMQNLFGNQNKNHYIFQAKFVYKFK